MKPDPVTYVAGHANPDTDSVASAVVCAHLLDRTQPGRRHEPIMLGPAQPQTRWLFEQAGVHLPRIRADIRPTASETCSKPVALRAQEPLGRAIDLLHEHGFSLVPVVDDANRFLGAVGYTLAESRYFTLFNLEDFFGTLVSAQDFVANLNLTPVNSVPVAETAPHQAAFRLHHSGHQASAGDALLSGPEAEAVRAAERAGCALLVFADCSPEDARRLASDCTVPAFHFAGSLMALVTQLPRAIPVGRVLSESVPVARPEDVLEDLRGLFARTPHALPVVDAFGHLTGMVSRREALEPPRPGLVLVDHFEDGQTVRGWQQAEILLIVDHHRIGGIETIEPAAVDCRPLGSTATILALRHHEAGVAIERSDALLLLGALLSDTLLLTSPTTTTVDRDIARELSEICSLDMQAFGRELLRRNDGLASEPAPALVQRDIKAFARGDLRFLLGQIETVDLSALTPDRIVQLRSALEGARAKAGAAFALTMVTDVLSGISRLIAADPEPARARHLLAAGAAEDTPERRMVSRKKELVPLVMNRLGTYTA